MKLKYPYTEPEILAINLDSAIALQLASDADPLGEPDWLSYNPSDRMDTDQMV